MKIIDTYHAFAKEMFLEAEVDDDKIIKYKKKDGEQGEMKASSAKTMPKDHPAKIAYDKMTDSDSDSDTPKGQSLGSGDFERGGNPDKGLDPRSPYFQGDPGYDSDDGDSERGGGNPDKGLDPRSPYFQGDPGYDSDDGEQKSAESENEKIIGDLEKMDLPDGFNLNTPDSEIDGGRYGVITGKDDDPDNELSVNAITGEDGKVEYGINIGSGGTPIYFNSKEEAMEATEKLLDDATIRDAMNGESDPAGVTLADLGDHAKNVLKSDDDPSKPIPAAPTETKVINGVKYRPIKESKKEEKDFTKLLNENYKRFSRK